MKKILNTVFAAFISVFVTTATFAQEETTKNEFDFKVDLTEELSFFNLDNGTITEWNTNFTIGDVFENGTLDISLPIYNDPNTAQCGSELSWQLNNGVYGNSGVGVGDIGIKVKYADAFKLDKIAFDVVGGIKVPLDGAFSSSDVTPFVGLEFDIPVETFVVTESVVYNFVDNYTYNPLLGGFVDSDVLESTTTISYVVSDKVSVSANVNAVFADGQSAVVVGPSVKYSLNNRIEAHAGIGFAVVDDLDFDELDSVVSFGIQFKF